MTQDCGKEFCPEHSENTKMLNSHAGQWKVALAVITSLIGFCVYQYTQLRNYELLSNDKMDKIGAYVANMDKNVSTILATHAAQTAEIYARLDVHKTLIFDNSDRIEVLQKETTDNKRRIQTLEGRTR